jgi:PAS domain S-box-containing protein
MLSEHLQEQAALFAAGALTTQQREQFELVVEFHDELREFVKDLVETSAAVTMATGRDRDTKPTPELKARMFAAIANTPQEVSPDALVMSGPDGLVQWINPAFSAMCGYTLKELRGKKLGPILQGEDTDRETANGRNAVHACLPCRETTQLPQERRSYWVEIAITPIRDDSGHTCTLGRARARHGFATAYQRSSLPGIWIRINQSRSAIIPRRMRA